MKRVRQGCETKPQRTKEIIYTATRCNYYYYHFTILTLSLSVYASFVLKHLHIVVGYMDYHYIILVTSL